MKLVLKSLIVTFAISSTSYAAKKESWCCMVGDQIASHEIKGKSKNLCLRATKEPSKSKYAKQCKKMAGKWLKKQK